MPAVYTLPYKFKTGFKLGAAALIILIQKCRITAQFTQHGKLCQKLHLTAPEIRPAHGIQLIFKFLRISGIEFLLIRSHAHIYSLFHFIRKLFEHLLLHAAQYKRMHHASKTVAHLFIFHCYYRYFIGFLESRIIKQESGHKVIHDAPQLTKMILNGRTCKCQTE